MHGTVGARGRRKKRLEAGGDGYPPAGSMKDVKARFRYQDALIAEHFHYTPSQIAELTPRQIQEMLFHARDERGGLVAPREELREPRTMEEELAVLEQMYNLFGGALEGGQERYRAAREEVRKRWEGKGGG